MKQNRRDFLKQMAVGAVGVGFIEEMEAKEPRKRKTVKKPRQLFNMSGYRAPKIDVVRVGFVGVGNRGYSNLRQMMYLENVEIKAICDVVPFRIDEAQQLLSKRGFSSAKVYSGGADAWKGLCEDEEIDLVSIAVPRGPLHAAISIYAMQRGKHVAVEVPAISTMEEAWEEVETSEKSRRHCYMMENCCYDFFELLTINMARQGFFGNLIHADAAYIHHQTIHVKTRDNNMWCLAESQHHTGNLYPTHGLGPVCQAMDINRGDKLNYMVSISSNDFMLGKKVSELAREDPFYRPFDTNSYRGNINTSVIRTEKGKTIMLQHDTTSPRVYTRIHMLSGTLAAALKYPEPGRISIGHQWLDNDQMAKVTEQYMPEIVKRIGEMAKQVGGHGGMDFLMSWRLIDCLRNDLPMDIDVYDAAAWSCIVPLSEESVKRGSVPLEIPDFTRGAWKTNQPHDIGLKEGGTMRIRG